MTECRTVKRTVTVKLRNLDRPGLEYPSRMKLMSQFRLMPALVHVPTRRTDRTTDPKRLTNDMTGQSPLVRSARITEKKVSLRTTTDRLLKELIATDRFRTRKRAFQLIL